MNPIMTLRKKTLLIVATTMLACLLGLYFISHLFLLSKFETLERSRIQDRVSQAQRLLQHKALQLELMATTLGQVLEQSTEFVRDVQRALAVERADIDLVAVVDPHLEGGIRLEHRLHHQPMGLTDQQHWLQALARLPDTPPGLLVVQGEPWLLGGYQLAANLTATGGRQLWLARRLDGVELAKLGQLIGGTARVQTSVADETKTSARVFWPAPGQIGSRLVLEDLYAQPVLALTVAAPATILSTGRHGIKLFLVTAAIAAVGLFLISLILHERLLLRRLIRLMRDVSAISQHPLRGQRVRVMGNDELSTLAKTINQALAKLEDKHQQLQDNEQQLSELIEAIPDLVCFKDAEGRWQRINRNGLRILGVDSADVLGKRNEEIAAVNMLIADPLRLDTEKGLQVKYSRTKARYEAVFDSDNGRYCLDMIKIPLADETGAHKGMVVLGRDITESKKAQALIERQANYDCLTGLPNRNLLQERLRQAIQEAPRHDTQLAVVFVDLDRFKSINDSLGHESGDLLLKAVAQRLQSCLRQTDTVARQSGDEFVVLLCDFVTIEPLFKICELILECFNKPFNLQGYEVLMSASLGVATYPGDADSPEKLFKYADTAMYAAKEAGRGQYCCFSPEMEAAAATATTITWALRSALKLKQLSVHYQPVIDLDTETLCGVEALLRWQHPELGVVSPAVFIPLAEERGLIGELGEWVMWQAARDIASLKGCFPANAYVAINVSSRQWRLHDMCALVQQTCDETGLLPTQLVLEITEQSLITDIEFVSQQLRELELLGVRAILDDFGTGYSSLSYLKILPVSGLKIDRAFINGVTDSREDAALVRATLAIAQSMHLRVVAEGVETLEQRDWLKNEGVRHIQGYLYARPMPLAELQGLLSATQGVWGARASTHDLSQALLPAGP